MNPKKFPGISAEDIQATTNMGRIKAVVARYIEPVTRFNGSDLTETGLEKEYNINVELMIVQILAISSEIRLGPDKITKGVEKVSGKSEFEANLQRRLSCARNEGPQAVKNWADENPGLYRRMMPSSAGFLRDPGSVGYEHICNTCYGESKLICSPCSGTGKLECASCLGDGGIRCYSCNGSTRKSCSSCGGSGQIGETQYEGNTSRYVYKRCYACLGVGTSHCSICVGGKTRCHRCGASGLIVCQNCDASGKIDCDKCLASGVQHVIGELKAEIKLDENLLIATVDDELRKLIEKNIALKDLPSYGRVLQMSHKLDGNILYSKYLLTINLCQATIVASERQFNLYGFGPKTEVFSFGNIVSHMLLEDLIRLEQKIKGATWWRRGDSNVLLLAIQEFLRSEINMIISERSAKDISLKEESSQQFKGMLDLDYISRTEVVLKKGFERLYSSVIFEPAAYLAGLAALTGCAIYGLNWSELGFWPAFLLSTGAYFLSWFALERLTRRRIGRLLGEKFGQRVLDQLKNSKKVRRWRMVMLFAGSSVVALAIFCINKLPIVQAHHQTLQERYFLDDRLSQWAAQTQVDFGLRYYPSHTLLLEKAESGDPRAQIILVWQLLLGADGVEKNVAAAGLWLDKHAAIVEMDSLAQAANAVYVLNQESTPESIKEAAKDLGKIANKGLVEARYWQSRIYLTKQGPLFDARRGLKALTDAADRGHAHAALLLGQKLAKGEGVRRDAIKARSYLMRASAAGLSDAQKTISEL